MKVTFLTTRVVQDQHVGTADETKFLEGKTYDLPESSANRWILRGVAERYLTKAEKASEKAAAAAATKDAAERDAAKVAADAAAAADAEAAEAGAPAGAMSTGG